MDEQNKIINKALNYTYFFLKFRPRTKKEIQTYLYKKLGKEPSFNEKTLESVFSKLEKLGLVDDRNFIAWYVEQRTQSRHEGLRVIKSNLLRLGIQPELLEEYFSSYPISQEEEQAKIALLKRWQRWQALPEVSRRQKAYGYLARKGYDFFTIKKTVAELELRE